MKWMRYTARIVALIWAGWWTFFGIACGIGEGMSPLGILIHAALPGLVFLVSVGIAWRWEIVGGIVLVTESLFVCIAYLMIFNRPSFSGIIFVLLTMALPPLVAGLLFIASRKKSIITKR